MNYKDYLIRAMQMLAADKKVVFAGYNVAYGGMGGGTFKGIDQNQLIEFPLSENLMMGACIGLSLEGLIPVCFFERCDFMLLAMDAIVNHLDKLSRLSEGLHKPAVIIRVVIGNSKVPLFTGLTHTQNLSKALRLMVDFPVVELHRTGTIEREYARALACTFYIEDNNSSCGVTKDQRRNKGKWDWELPHYCVQGYHYQATYPHAGTNVRPQLKWKP